MKRSWIAAILIICLLLTGLGVAIYWRSTPKTVITCGDISLDNTDFAYYYWSEYFYFAEVYGDYLKDDVDFQAPLRDQPYDDEMSWEDYLLEDTFATVQDTLVMVLAAEEAGFTLPADYDSAYQESVVNFRSAATKAGCKDLNEYLRDSYGPKAKEESFLRYLHQTYLASAYADHLLEQIVIPDADVAAYFTDHQADYETVYGFDADAPEQWMESVRQELQLEQYQNEFRGIQHRFPMQLNRAAISLRPPKGLYKK